MTVENWITLGIFGIGQITALVVTYINVRVKIKELEVKLENMQEASKNNTDNMKESIKNNKDAIYIHEQQNEKTFDKIESKIDAVYETINEVKNILIAKNFN